MLIANFPLLHIVLAGMFTREETSNMELQIFVDLPTYSGFAFPWMAICSPNLYILVCTQFPLSWATQLRLLVDCCRQGNFFFSKYLNVNKYQTEVIIVLTFAVKGYVFKELVQNSVWNSLYNLRPYKFLDAD